MGRSGKEFVHLMFTFLVSNVFHLGSLPGDFAGCRGLRHFPVALTSIIIIAPVITEAYYHRILVFKPLALRNNPFAGWLGLL